MMNKLTKAVKQAKGNPYVGSSVDEFFAADGLLQEMEAAAMKRVIAQAQIAEVNANHISQNCSCGNSQHAIGFISFKLKPIFDMGLGARKPISQLTPQNRTKPQ